MSKSRQRVATAVDDRQAQESVAATAIGAALGGGPLADKAYPSSTRSQLSAQLQAYSPRSGGRKCVRFQPLAEGYDQLDKAFGTAVNPHIKPPSK